MLCQISHITKSYETPNREKTIPVLNDISLCINAGESVAIIGPSGSGKTTLLNITATLDRQYTGTVYIDKQDVSKLSENDLALLRNTKIGIVFQQHYLLPQCTLIENVLIPTLAWPKQGNKADAIKRAHSLIERVGLSKRIHHKPNRLSGGECQRVAVIRALINRPAILCADEPTGSLDRASAQSLGKLLVELNREERLALIVVTHSQDLSSYMDQCFLLSEGRLNLEN